MTESQDSSCLMSCEIEPCHDCISMQTVLFDEFARWSHDKVVTQIEVLDKFPREWLGLVRHYVKQLRLIIVEMAPKRATRIGFEKENDHSTKSMERIKNSRLKYELKVKGTDVTGNNQRFQELATAVVDDEKSALCAERQLRVIGNLTTPPSTQQLQVDQCGPKLTPLGLVKEKSMLEL
ncbi:hypothetical protein Tco_0519456 [Tanacetum coccineum]